MVFKAPLSPSKAFLKMLTKQRGLYDRQVQLIGIKRPGGLTWPHGQTAQLEDSVQEHEAKRKGKCVSPFWFLFSQICLSNRSNSPQEIKIVSQSSYLPSLTAAVVNNFQNSSRQTGYAQGTMVHSKRVVHS